MSTRLIRQLICDGCGTLIEVDSYIRVRPSGQAVIQKDKRHSYERDFCCEACQSWWFAQFPADGPWGPAWDERDRWSQHSGTYGQRAHVRTTHDDMPLVDTH